MILTEIVKSFIEDKNAKVKVSSTVPKEKVLMDLNKDSESYPNTGSFFDDKQEHFGLFGMGDRSDYLHKQKEKIMKYRQMSMNPNVVDAIDEIVNEIIFSYDDKIPLKIDIDEENETLVKAIIEKFEKILKLLDVKRSLFQIVKRGYVDGIMIMHCAFNKNLKDGIYAIKMIEPIMLYFDTSTKTFKYYREKDFSTFQSGVDVEYSIEEIIKEDFGLYDNNINLSYLEYAIKSANLLQTLEDLLVPLRFSRSISRRVFNVDIGDLPTKRGKEVMDEHQAKFKYKKFYNNETGEVSNQQHITSMVEDYWFSNRSGGKGTTVDVLDESGNLGELGDIIYLSKKLYKALKVPSNRISLDSDGDKDFDFDSTRVSKEDLKFFMFISRLRQVYSSLFKEILKREVIACGIMNQDEWDEKEDLIRISFVNENKFIEKMTLDNFTRKLEIYATAQDYQGKLFSVNTILKNIFKFTDEEIDEEMKKIQKEEKNKLYSKFYQKDDEL
jgi:hypothetical protein